MYKITPTYTQDLLILLYIYMDMANVTSIHIETYLFMLADEHIQCYTLAHVIIIVLGKTLMAQWAHYVTGTVLSTFFNLNSFNLHPMR